VQSHYDEHFVREMGCTLSEWQGWLPAAIGSHPWSLADEGARIDLDALQSGASLQLQWQALPVRAIALARIPRLQVSFTFNCLDAHQRYTFMKRFDLYMQRGGG
jgi:hypothetical protein